MHWDELWDWQDDLAVDLNTLDVAVARMDNNIGLEFDGSGGWD